ncbi:T9SS type A sorting domain-containing protein [bacterium]|nr:T9SS type A sorting domain-containing protein [bacterium]
MKNLLLLLVLVLSAIAPAEPMAADHPDDIYWSNQFAAENGVNGPIYAVTEYDNKLVVAGNFTRAGGRTIPYIAAWDGYAWSAVGTLNIHGPVYALHVFDGKLYAGGSFYLNDSSDVFGKENLAVLNGGNWQWVYGYADDTVFAISDFNGYLVIGGAFHNVGGNSAAKVAYLDGTRWNRFENTLGGSVYSIATYRGDLIVAGSIDYRYPPGGMTEWIGSVARWNGTRFVSLNMGFSMISSIRKPRVYDLLVRSDRLIACGYMDYALSEYVHNVASWDGSSWHAIGGGIDSTGWALIDYRDTVMVASGRAVLAWNGASWSPRGDPATGGSIRTLSYTSRYSIVAGGAFTAVGDKAANYLVTYSTSQGWLPVTTGVNASVTDITVFDNRLFVVGSFSRVAQQRAFRVAALDGSSWANVGSLQNYPQCLATFDGQLYAAGAFGNPTLPVMYPFQAFDGAGSWSLAGPTIGPWPAAQSMPVVAAVEYDGRLVAGGLCPFLVPPFLSSWSGTGGWQPLGLQPNGQVMALTTYRGQLVVGGAFTSIGGIAANCIAFFDGSEWSSPGGGMDGVVYAFAEYRGLLIAGGTFLTAGGQPAARIAAWDGDHWAQLGDGLDGAVRALTEYGSRLVAGGLFTQAGGVEASHIAAWDEHGWNPLGSGVDGLVLTLCTHDTSLYVGGSFSEAGAKSSPFFARWDGYLNIPTAVGDDPVAALPNEFTLHQNYPNPFNPTTTISFSIPGRSRVKLTVFNILGQEVVTLLDRALAAGRHEVIWDASVHASGVYFYRLETEENVDTRTMVLVK